MSNPFASNYTTPLAKTKYLKFQKGANLFRILTPKEEVVSYYIDFVINDEGKKTKNIYPDNGDGQFPMEAEEPKLVWAVTVFNLDINEVQILEISQKTIKDFLFSITSGKIKTDWTLFDIQVTKTGDDKDTTKYSMIAGNDAELSEVHQSIISSTFVDLSQMELGGDPFDFSAGSKKK